MSDQPAVFTAVPTAWHMSKIFPMTITIGGTSLTLHADDKITGSDLAAVRQALANAEGMHDGVSWVLLWLIAAEMERRARK